MPLHFDSFGTEYIPQEVLNKIKDKSITQNLFRIKSDDSTVSILLYRFIQYSIVGKTLLDYNNLFPPNDYKKND